jgi:hypothetical protein
MYIYRYISIYICKNINQFLPILFNFTTGAYIAMYVLTYIFYIHIYIHIHICIFIHLYTCINAYFNTNTHTFIHTHTYIHVSLCI